MKDRRKYIREIISTTLIDGKFEDDLNPEHIDEVTDQILRAIDYCNEE